LCNHLHAKRLPGSVVHQGVLAEFGPATAQNCRGYIPDDEMAETNFSVAKNIAIIYFRCKPVKHWPMDWREELKWTASDNGMITFQCTTFKHTDGCVQPDPQYYTDALVEDWLQDPSRWTEEALDMVALYLISIQNVRLPLSNLSHAND